MTEQDMIIQDPRREKLAELLGDAPYNIYGDRLDNLCCKAGLEIAAEYLIARGGILNENQRQQHPKHE